MRIAIFHDYISFIGGGEKLVLTLAQELKADVITTDKDMQAIKNMEFENINIISIGNTIKIPLLKQISASIKFAVCDFSDKYDYFVFSGNWAPFASKKHKPNLLYCHTPVRVFYDLYDDFSKRQSFFGSILFKLWVNIYRRLYEHYIAGVCKIIVNSKGTQERIRKYLNRDSKIIYPPINTYKFRFEKHRNFWLSVNRLYPEKRIGLQIEAFRQLPEERLYIVGGYTEGDHSPSYVDSLMKNLPNNIKFLGNVKEEMLIELYAHCKGFIITSVNEDFGMTPVEAMASGKPVIGMNEGGCLETIINGKTGLLVNPNVPEIINAINILSNDLSERTFEFKDNCIEQSKKFDIKIFIDQMRKEIHE